MELASYAAAVQEPLGGGSEHADPATGGTAQVTPMKPKRQIVKTPSEPPSPAGIRPDMYAQSTTQYKH